MRHVACALCCAAIAVEPLHARYGSVLDLALSMATYTVGALLAATIPGAAAMLARAMTERGPRARLVEWAGIGHAPTFMHEDQIALARGFFLD